MENRIPDIPLQGEDAAARARQLHQQGNCSALSAKRQQQINKISRDFEGLFIGMMLKSMHETVGKDPLTGGGRSEEIYRSLLDQEYVAAAVKRGGFGLAKQVEKDIIRQEGRRCSGIIDTRE